MKNKIHPGRLYEMLKFASTFAAVNDMRRNLCGVFIQRRKVKRQHHYEIQASNAHMLATLTTTEPLWADDLSLKYIWIATEPLRRLLKILKPLARPKLADDKELRAEFTVHEKLIRLHYTDKCRAYAKQENWTDTMYDLAKFNDSGGFPCKDVARILKEDAEFRRREVPGASVSTVSAKYLHLTSKAFGDLYATGQPCTSVPLAIHGEANGKYYDPDKGQYVVTDTGGIIMLTNTDKIAMVANAQVLIMPIAKNRQVR